MVPFGYPKWLKLGIYIQWYMESIWGLLGSMSIRQFCHKWQYLKLARPIFWPLLTLEGLLITTLGFFLASILLMYT